MFYLRDEDIVSLGRFDSQSRTIVSSGNARAVKNAKGAVLSLLISLPTLSKVALVACQRPPYYQGTFYRPTESQDITGYVRCPRQMLINVWSPARRSETQRRMTRICARITARIRWYVRWLFAM